MVMRLDVHAVITKNVDIVYSVTEHGMVGEVHLVGVTREEILKANQ